MRLNVLPSGNTMFCVDNYGQSKYKYFGGLDTYNLLVLN